MAERLFCSRCNRTFRNSEALSMHNSAKHSGNVSSGSSSISAIKPSRKMVVRIMFIIGVALIILGLFGFIRGDNVVDTSNLITDEPFLGDENAPVTIVEFGDYQCPICQRFHANTLPQIKSEYIETGKVKYIFKDFPLTRIHPMAQKLLMLLR